MSTQRTYDPLGFDEFVTEYLVVTASTRDRDVIARRMGMTWGWIAQRLLRGGRSDLLARAGNEHNVVGECASARFAQGPARRRRSGAT